MLDRGWIMMRKIIRLMVMVVVVMVRMRMRMAATTTILGERYGKERNRSKGISLLIITNKSMLRLEFHVQP